MLNFWLPVVMCFVAVAALMPLCARLALRGGFVDAPGGRKQHEAPVPPIGGLVWVPVFLLIHFYVAGDIQRDWPLYVGCAMLLGVGVIDDRFPIDAWIKFAVQILVAVMVVVFGACHIENLGDMFGYGDLWLGFMSVPFSIAAVALLVNAINLMDGVDGLSGGQGALIVIGLLVAAYLSGAFAPVQELSLLLAALMGFLLHNMRSPLCVRARVFMGDAGTLCLGLCLAWFAIGAANNNAIALEPISVAWFLALPIMDECAQFYRRVREGRHPFTPDRGHFHHAVLDAGFRAGHATLIVLTVSGALGALGYGLLLAGVPQIFLTLAWIGLILVHMGLTAHGKGVYARLFSALRK